MVKYTDKHRFNVAVAYPWDALVSAIVTANPVKRRISSGLICGRDVLDEFAEGRRGTEFMLKSWRGVNRRDVDGFSSFVGGLDACYAAMAEGDAWDSAGYEPVNVLGRICKSPLVRLKECLDIVKRLVLHLCLQTPLGCPFLEEDPLASET
jgi:hypothetical protein